MRNRFQKGYTPWNKGLTKEVDSRLIRTEEYINSVKGKGNTFYGKKHTKESKIKIANRYYPKGKDHPSYGKHIWTNRTHPMTGKSSKGPWLGKHRSEETKSKIRIANLGKHPSKKTRKKMKMLLIERWKKVEFIENWKRGMENYKKNVVYPTNPENNLLRIILENDISFEYTGDGRRWINKFNPDFINKNEKLIIEVFGDYWHNLSKIQKRDELRLKKYEENGYKTLILWEHELTGRGGGKVLTDTQIINKIKDINNYIPNRG